MTDFARPIKLLPDFYHRSDFDDQLPEKFEIPAPVIVGNVALSTFDELVDSVDTEKIGLNAYGNHNYAPGPSAFRVYQAEKYPHFAASYDAIVTQMIEQAREGTENFDKLKPVAHKMRINGRNYKPHSTKPLRWKTQWEPSLVVTSDEAVDFVVGEIATDDPDFASTEEHSYRSFLTLWLKKETYDTVIFHRWKVDDLSDEQIAEKGLEIVTLAPGEVAMMGLGHIMRRRVKEIPGEAYMQLEFERPSHNEYYFPKNK